MLKINQTAPLDIKVTAQDDSEVSLRDMLGKPVVLYFYPKDNTPGCTKEACSFRDFNTELQELGIQVIGVSADSVKSHNNFFEKHTLNFPLWSDPEKKLLEAFGALGEKSMFGKKYIGIIRSTFALDESGKVIQVWPKVKVANHTQEVIEFFKSRN
jgi:peroxiredoxin Q/BCP